MRLGKRWRYIRNDRIHPPNKPSPGRTWTGQYDAIGVIIIVKEDGE
ncbi:MAG: hypothetical protein ACE5GV_08760 [Candidatus Scalindua sp.]